MKRIVTIQDISCLGKCSLTVALPVISAMGVEAAIVPTAVLSTHTMFKNFTFHDLTDQIAPIGEHWQKENFDFDAIYTGYLGSFEQIQLVTEFFERFKTEKNQIIVDPAMGDSGNLYTGFNEDFAKEMAKLCGKADLILPNLTEACFMTGIPYRGGKNAGYGANRDDSQGEAPDRAYYQEVLLALAELGAKKVVLTGASTEPGKTGFMGYDTETRQYFSYSHSMQPTSYHGTGDIFSSTTVGALMRGYSLEEALTIAADFTSACIRITIQNGKAPWYGVDFEQAIPMLIQRLGSL